MVSVMSTRMKPAAAALSRKAASGRDVQLNIWIGMTVNGANSQSKGPAGGSPANGAGGRKAMKVSAPTVMIGAVSPIARAMPMITPVRMPALEYGMMWSETTVRCELLLQHGGSLELYGRIDRIDRHTGGGDSLLDYKTQRRSAIKKRLPDDIQLASYALMHGTATETAYLALDDETIAALSASDSADALADAAKAQGQRLSALFSDLHQGTPLPAHGVESLCRYCEMSGLCRREYLG